MPPRKKPETAATWTCTFHHSFLRLKKHTAPCTTNTAHKQHATVVSYPLVTDCLAGGAARCCLLEEDVSERDAQVRGRARQVCRAQRVPRVLAAEPARAAQNSSSSSHVSHPSDTPSPPSRCLPACLGWPWVRRGRLTE